MESLPASPATSPERLRGRPWILVAGALLAALGYALEPAPQTGGDQGGTGTELTAPALNTTVLGMTDSNNRMIAVTGVDLTGAAILYLVDTVNPHIAVYQASGGSSGTQSIRLVAARRIDLDLQLDGLNDRSDFSYKELRKRFDEQP